MNFQLFPSDKVFTVSEINNLLKEILEGSFPQIVIEGEISNYRPNSSGHLYFTLKDASSQISAVMFKGNACSLQFVPKDGIKVRCTGRLSVYSPRGNYQIILSKMEVAGEGDILKMLEERKKRFYLEGLFDESSKKEIPYFPKTVGVVTSPTGAALRDILQITKRRNKCVSVIVFPAIVQGEEASTSIAQQIRNANVAKLCDVLIVGRGGGSLEDLLPFSDELVVRAVAQSEIPVISAVGHEIDWALCDYAADRRAPTPSAAAELAVPLLSEIIDSINRYKSELYRNAMNKAENTKLLIKSFDPENLELSFRAIEQPLLNRFERSKEFLQKNITEKIQETRQKIQNCVTVLENASPQTILAKGYSMVRNKENGKIIRAANEISVGNLIEIIPAKGKITATVQNVEN